MYLFFDAALIKYGSIYGKGSLETSLQYRMYTRKAAAAICTTSCSIPNLILATLRYKEVFYLIFKNCVLVETPFIKGVSDIYSEL